MAFHAMGKHVQTVADHWQIILTCVLFVFITQVNSQDNNLVNITLVHDAVQKGAVCIDGSPAGYHYAPGSGTGVDNWVIYLQGGGWCYSLYTCKERLRYPVGSTKNITTAEHTGILNSNQSLNPDFYNWNRVFVRYCDGGSYIGDTKKEDSGYTFQFRGSRIFSAVMDELLAKGMKNADNAIIAGGSAGGLGTILYCDRFRALLPNTSRVKCVSDSGFFIRAKDLPNANFREETFAQVVEYHNLTQFIPGSCTSRMNSSLCLFPEYLVGEIQTPLFLLNSAFDKYEIQANLKPNPPDMSGWYNCTNDTNICSPAQVQLIKDFQKDFLKTLNDADNNPTRGLFINSCYLHTYIEFNDLWNSDRIKLQNKTISEAIADWYFDRDSVQLIDTQNDFALNCTV